MRIMSRFSKLLVALSLALLTGSGLAAAIAGPSLRSPPAATGSNGLRLAQDDVDAFMEKVLEKRELNWEATYDYVFNEVERFRISGVEIAALQSFDQEYTWYVRDGYLVRSPWSINGVEVDKETREKAELDWIEKVKNDEEDERIRGLAIGADDYVVKPFSVPELMARVKALLRRSRPEMINQLLHVADLELDRETFRVRRNGREIHLGPTEFRLLEFLMQSPGRVFSRAQLLDSVWGHDVYVDERTVDVHIGRLRKSINRGRLKDPIRTVRGAGYAFNEQFGGV